MVTWGCFLGFTTLTVLTMEKLDLVIIKIFWWFQTCWTAYSRRWLPRKDDFRLFRVSCCAQDIFGIEQSWLTSRKNMAIENPPFIDEFCPVSWLDFPACHVWLPEDILLLLVNDQVSNSHPREICYKGWEQKVRSYFRKIFRAGPFKLHIWAGWIMFTLAILGL